LNDERLCSTDGNVADEKLNSNGYATSYLGKRVLGYGVISSRRDVTAHQRITRCLEIQHRVVATPIALPRVSDSQQSLPSFRRLKVAHASRSQKYEKDSITFSRSTKRA
jgi:hypothetical protein